MSIIGSYTNGFAPRDGEPLFPELWKDCVGVWAPCLGPSGLLLRDWSEKAGNGILTNGPLWLPRIGRQSIYFDGTDDRVTVTIPTALSSNWSVYASVVLDVLRDPCAVIGSTSQEIVTDSGGYFFTQRINGYAAPSSSIFGQVVAGRVTHLCVTMSPTKQVTYSVNGRRTLSGSADMSAYDVTLPASLRIGSSGLDGRSFIGSVFDVRIYKRVLAANEEQLLASEIGVAYKRAPNKRSRVFTGGFKAYWAARKAQIIGGGL